MPAKIKNNKKSLIDVGFYDGLDNLTKVPTGVSQLPYQIYHSKEYQKRKEKPIVVGGINRVVYSGFDHDPTPIILVWGEEPKYNTIIGLNLRYMKPKQKQALLDFVIVNNKLNIKQKKPLIFPDYQLVKRRFPYIEGAVRRYKVVLIGVVETVPLIGWNDVVKESSPYSGVATQYLQAKRNR